MDANERKKLKSEYRVLQEELNGIKFSRTESVDVTKDKADRMSAIVKRVLEIMADLDK